MPEFDLAFELSAPLRVGGAFVLSLVLLLVVRTFGMRWARNVAASTASQLDDVVVGSLRYPSIFWAAALALEGALAVAEVSAEFREAFGKGVGALVIFSMTLVVANISSGVLGIRLRSSSGAAAASGIARTLVRGFVILGGISVVLHSLGVSVGPLLTALGVGGLAVALALQDTLGNLFAGIHLLLEKPFAIGHFVRIEGGDEGWVQDIGWRTTRLLTLADHTVVIPNSQIAGSKVINMNLPEPAVRVERKVGVSYSSDPANVERVLLDELQRAVRELPGTLTTPSPDVLLEGLGPYSMDYTVRFYVKQFSFERAMSHLVLTRLVVRLRAENIEIPFPYQVVELRGSGAAVAK